VWEWQNHEISFQKKPEDQEMFSSSKESQRMSEIVGGREKKREKSDKQ
jgi:hypothetical protein